MREKGVERGEKEWGRVKLSCKTDGFTISCGGCEDNEKQKEVEVMWLFQ